MAIALPDLVKNLDRKEVLDDFVQVAKALGLSTTGWQPGEPIYDVLTIFADQITNLWNDIIVKAIRAVFLDYAEGTWLTIFAGTFYETWRREATFASGSLRIENRSSNFYNLSAGDLKIQNSAGKTFTSQNAVTLAPWSGVGFYPTATVTFQADEAGTSSNTAIGDFAGYPTPLLSAPTGLYAITNTTAFLGSDEETDAELKARARLTSGRLSPASPRSAYETVALSVHAGADRPLLPEDDGYEDAPAVNVTRIRVVEPGNGLVEVYLASPAGAAAGDTSTAGTDVFLVNAAIQERVVPAGITCTVESAIQRPIAYGVITVYVDRASLVTAEEAKADATRAFLAFFETLPIGGMRKVPAGQGYVFADELKAKMSESNPGIFRVELTLPFGSDSEGNIALSVGEVAVGFFTSINAVLVTQT